MRESDVPAEEGEHIGGGLPLADADEEAADAAVHQTLFGHRPVEAAVVPTGGARGRRKKSEKELVTGKSINVVLLNINNNNNNTPARKSLFVFVDCLFCKNC